MYWEWWMGMSQTECYFHYNTSAIFYLKISLPTMLLHTCINIIYSVSFLLSLYRNASLNSRMYPESNIGLNLWIKRVHVLMFWLLHCSLHQRMHNCEKSVSYRILLVRIIFAGLLEKLPRLKVADINLLATQ